MNLSLFFDQYFVHPVQLSSQSLAYIIVAMVLILAFELWMLVDVLAYRKVPTKQRLWWVLGMFLVQPLVAIAYLLVRSKYKQA